MRRPRSITEFRPAKPNRAFINLMRLVNRFYVMPRARLGCQIREIEKLRNLPPGVMIIPNHSDYADALVVTELTRRARRFVTFMATRETFDVHRGLDGLVLQWMGGFSVNRGGGNAKCQQFAKEIVKRREYDLLIFPEGEVYLLNDLVMQFKPGVAMLALEVASENRKAGRRERLVRIVPVAIKYHYLEDVTPALDEVTAGLEVTLFGERRSGPLYGRMYALGVELLNVREQEWGIHSDPTWDVYDRTRHVQKFLLDSLERRYLERVRDELPFDRARRLILHLLEALDTLRARQNLPEAERTALTAELRRDLRRAQAAARSVSFADDYLISRPTAERMAETVTKLAREIYGREAFLPKVKRTAMISVGDPIDVRPYLAGYDDRATRKETILRLTGDLQASIQTMIDAANSEIDAEARA